ncbi:SEC-C metal-binding domain-containing protein [Piscinibacter terrae]|uniref:Nucleic acid-binding protein n=1 Tax=Piscinibacter terrae TaxID=2496871 RepID=A0A3N7HLN8_9BURK|nr:hypothetical protein DZC73_22955 [Albitalea terrae]
MQTTNSAFTPSSKRRRGFPSESRVKRGDRFVHGDKELHERLGRNDPCVCGSGRSFQELLPEDRLLLTASTVTTTDVIDRRIHRGKSAWTTP